MEPLSLSPKASPENLRDAKKTPQEETGAGEKNARAFVFTELHLRTALGLNKDEVRALRQQHLVEGEHWVLYHKRVVYSLAGAVRLQELVGVSGELPEINAAPSSNADQPEALAEVLTTLVVYRTGLRNGRIILAHKKGAERERLTTADLVRVRVRRDKNLVRGMEIPCRLLPGYKDLYELAHALPRRRGVW